MARYLNQTMVKQCLSDIYSQEAFSTGSFGIE
jgi:hypothetical protein